MRVKVYVNWEETDLLSEKEYQDRIEEAIEEVMNDEDAFSMACEGNLSLFEMFYMNSNNKDDIEKVKSFVRQYVQNEFEYSGWEEVEIET